MKKLKKNGLRVVFVVIAITLVASLMYSCKKTYDIQEVPSSVAWSQDVKDLVETIRQSENNEKAREKLEPNFFPLKVLNTIPVLAGELNLPWANNTESMNLRLSIFTAEDKLTLLDERKNKKFKANLNGYEPGFIVEYDGKNHYYFLESFTEILDVMKLNILSVRNYSEYQENNTSKVLRSVEFKNNFYPCSIHDDIDFWIKFSQQEDIKLLGRFTGSDFIWEKIPYNEAQKYLDMGYTIILDLPQNSKYIKLQSGQEFIKTPERKIAMKLL